VSRGNEAHAALTIDARRSNAPTPARSTGGREARIFIPRTAITGLSIAGNCRILPRGDRQESKLQIACNMPVTKGWSSTQTAPGRKGPARRAGIPLRQSSLDCPVCDQSENATFRTLHELRPVRPRFREQKVKKRRPWRSVPRDVGSGTLHLCSRCVRFTDEISRTGEFGIFNAGTAPSWDSIPVTARQPLLGQRRRHLSVGALTDRNFRFKARVLYLSCAPTVCNGCAQGCNVDIHYVLDRPHLNEGARVLRLKPRYNADVNSGGCATRDATVFGWIDNGR